MSTILGMEPWRTHSTTRTPPWTSTNRSYSRWPTKDRTITDTHFSLQHMICSISTGNAWCLVRLSSDRTWCASSRTWRRKTQNPNSSLWWDGHEGNFKPRAKYASGVDEEPTGCKMENEQRTITGWCDARSLQSATKRPRIARIAIAGWSQKQNA